MSSIIDDKNKTIYVIKESVGGENKVSNIIEKLILNDIQNNVRLTTMMVIKLVVWHNISACESLFALIKRSIQI